MVNKGRGQYDSMGNAANISLSYPSPVANLGHDSHPSANITSINNSWQYGDRNFRGSRTFATGANTNDFSTTTTKPTSVSNTDDDVNNDDSTKETKTTTTTTTTTSVPKEYIDALKSEVEEMEAPPSHSHRPKNTPFHSSDEQQQFAHAMKTPDDFADYLKGEEVLLDGDTGLIVKRQNFGKNELKRKSKSTSTSSIRSSTVKKENILHSSSTSISSASSNNANNPIPNNDDNNNNNTTQKNTNNKPPTTQKQSDHALLSHQQQHPAYHYKFSPTDATLSDPQRSVDRRRAIEQTLQKNQAESRATTMKNVRRALGGNFIIAAAKLAAALSSGSSAMLSEFIHSVVDCGNQALLLVGLKSSQNAPDRSHPYGYGKAIYFWALVSALGTFFLGAGVSMTHSIGELMNPTPSMTAEVTKEVWGVLIMSFAVDGYVFAKTLQEVKASMRIDGSKKDGMSFWKYSTTKLRDPATLAVLLEDGAACLGVVIAIGGIGMTQYTGTPVWDSIAGVGISGLLAAMGVALAKVNHRFLIGQGIDRPTREGIEKIILSRRSIDNVYSVQSQWTGPDTFSYKAEVDFDGTFLAAKLLPRYQQEFFEIKTSLDRDLRVLLSWYAEDVMRAVEREVRHIEEEIRMQYPAAHYIELEPMSKDADRYAIDDGMEAQLRRVEIDVLNRYLKSLYKIKEGGAAGGAGTDTSASSSSSQAKKE